LVAIEGLCADVELRRTSTTAAASGTGVESKVRAGRDA
jgi:hypothetical protein